MREIKIILSAKLCAVTVFASYRGKNSASALHRSYRCYIYVSPLGSVARKLPQCFLPPLALKGVKNLKGVKLGRAKTCGILRQHKQPWTTWFALFATNKNATTNNTNL